jgi:glyoxylase-like metal-dependent hydrolase (beta-lactamase superfamily II)
MILEMRARPPLMKNGFVLGCDASHEGVIVDPGDEVQDLLEAARGHRLAIKYILLTHAHFDHVSGVAHAKAALDAPIGLHADDLFLYDMAGQQARSLGFRVDPQPPPDFFYEPDHRLAFGDHEIMVHRTPGHSPGGVCLQVGTAGKPGRHLIVGDTLFAGAIGRTDLPGGDLQTLMRSIADVLMGFPDDFEVYPGHGSATTIGEERRTNPFLTGEL